MEAISERISKEIPGGQQRCAKNEKNVSMTNHSDYFRRSEVSNSDLTKLKYQLSGRELPDMSAALLFGTVVDAMITEPFRINKIDRSLDGYIDIKHIYDSCERCVKALRNDTKAWTIITKADKQKISTSERQLSYNGVQFTLPVRCKWDFFGSISGDLKTTAAKTQKEFEAHCEYLEYYRARAWYMDIDNTNVDLIIGVSKHNQKIFYKKIIRGDENYQKGRQQYLELAFKYWILKM